MLTEELYFKQSALNRLIILTINHSLIHTKHKYKSFILNNICKMESAVPVNVLYINEVCQGSTNLLI